MIEKNVKQLETFSVPLRNVEIKLEDVTYEGGMKMLQLKIREGRRFTVLELDPETAQHWGAAMVEWAESNNSE